MERTSKGSGFKLRSGNMTSFKMMGARKSSAFQKTTTLDEVEVSGGAKAERGSDKFKRVAKETDALKADARLAN